MTSGHDTTVEAPDARATADRIERLLDELRGAGQPRVAALAEEMVSCLVGLYGAGLTRIVEILASPAVQTPEESGLLDRLAADPLVESLLLVHDLHPVDVDTRVQRALDRVRPYLGSHAGGVEYRGVDEHGVVHLTLSGSCQGCPSSTVTVRLTIEQAVAEAAPETAGVDVEGVVEPAGPPLLQITPRPGGTDRTPSGAPPGWTALPDPGSLAGPGPVRQVLDGIGVVLCRLEETWYAYRDACPACAAALSGGELAATVLSCPGCGGRYDVRLAGAGLDEPRRHLEPLPLLADGGQVRVATGALAAAAS
jgi:Fe-S cluster biogenesis protein NfuA/nitrite reductase/ring-hydroxylating ferredoxin subunit